MKQFMDEDFLLSTPTARTLYHEFAEKMPIIDYHCHLVPKEIAENKPFRNITHLFLGGDHYKWRFMASMGVDDKFIRGDGDEYEKFLCYARCISMAIGNPLYHWTHLELKRVFGISEPLTEKTAPMIWEKCNALLATPDFLPRRLIERFDVRVVCTTDDPVDTLEYHEMLAKDESFKVKVLPTFRPDKAVKIDLDGFKEYIQKLSAVSGIKIETVDDVVKALRNRAEFFAAHGCRISDHALDTVPYTENSFEKAQAALIKALNGEKPDACEVDAYRTYLMIGLGKIYHDLDWAQQYHMNAQRNNNGPIYRKYGADVGFDSISDEMISAKLNKLLNAQEENGCLPRTILYTLNPAANYILGTAIGNFQTQGGIAGKMQFGSAWWFCDQKDGMYEHMRTLAALGALSAFVGMLTDSRSFVSYPRHEYFRRILCDMIGQWVENGEYPCDMEALKKIVQGICFENAEKYFRF
ncbi:MAG: glucuronate isomerase [Clostridia bacterium]|nr:glucuronate isomerase [Clostridia bacterium]